MYVQGGFKNLLVVMLLNIVCIIGVHILYTHYFLARKASRKIPVGSPEQISASLKV